MKYIYILFLLMISLNLFGFMNEETREYLLNTSPYYEIEEDGQTNEIEYLGDGDDFRWFLLGGIELPMTPYIGAEQQWKFLYLSEKVYVIPVSYGTILSPSVQAGLMLYSFQNPRFADIKAFGEGGTFVYMNHPSIITSYVGAGLGLNLMDYQSVEAGIRYYPGMKEKTSGEHSGYTYYLDSSKKIELFNDEFTPSNKEEKKEEFNKLEDRDIKFSKDSSYYFYLFRDSYRLKLPAVDSLYSYQTPLNFSMRQSLETAYTVSHLAGYLPFKIFDLIDVPVRQFGQNDKAVLSLSPYGSIDYLLGAYGSFLVIPLFYIPGGFGWMHEEWHRAVMNHRDVESYDEIYDFNFFAPYVSVSGVIDEDLIRLKDEYPLDMVRMHAAGYESEGEINRMVTKKHFSESQLDFDMQLSMPYMMISLNSILYLYGNSLGSLDEDSDTMVAEAGTNEMERDFTWNDYTAWVYDLFRQDESYTNRGINVSGIGIKRQIVTNDLTTEELDYLQLQGKLAWLKLLNPYFLGRNYFRLKNVFGMEEIRLNAALTHELTCFGYDVVADLMFGTGDFNLITGLHYYHNKDHWFPGLEVEIYRYPLSILNYAFDITGELHGWMQPEDLSFRTEKMSPGLSGEIEVNLPVYQGFGVYLTGEAKTEGWKAGNVSLEPAADFHAGFSFQY